MSTWAKNFAMAVMSEKNRKAARYGRRVIRKFRKVKTK